MNESSPVRRMLRFGIYQCDLSTRELYKSGIKIKLADQPFRLLAVLLERPGDVVTRQELKERLWPDSSFGDFNDGLNTAVNKLRAALDDEAENPRFVETLPRRGYRFVAAVTAPDSGATASGREPGSNARGDSGDRVGIGTASGAAAGAAIGAATGASAGSSEASGQARRNGGVGTATGEGKKVRAPGWILSIVAVVVLGGTIAWFFYGRSALSFNSRDSVLVADFNNQTGDARFDRALEDAFVVDLQQSRRVNIFPQARTESVLEMMGKPAEQMVTAGIGREICQREGIRGLITAGITRTGNSYELTAQLIDPRTGEAVRSYSERSYGEDHILDALDRITERVRRDLGESLYQIHSASKPLPEVTTSSLVALKQYSDAVALWHDGHYAQSVALLQTAVQTDPKFAMAHAALGLAYFSYIRNDPVRGKQEYEKALALSSHTTDRERMIIQTHYAGDLGHVDEAAALYRLYLSRYPDDWSMLLDYARLLRLHGRANEAIAQYQRILRLAPDDANTYIEMATAYRTLDKLQESLAAYSEAFKIDRHELYAGNVGREYGAALIANGEDKKAAQIFTEQMGNPDSREAGMRSLALLDLYEGRYADAAKRFHECLLILDKKAYFSVARVHLWLGIIAGGEGDKRAEERQFDVAAQDLKMIGPKVVFGSIIGQAYARAGFLDKAEKVESAIAPLADAKNPDESGYLHLLQGEIAVAQKRYDDGINLLLLSNKENPTQLSSEALAHAYQQSGKINSAIPAYEGFISDSHSLLWEPQQRWLEAHVTLTEDYIARGNAGDAARARQVMGAFMKVWNGADANLPLLNQARAEDAKIQHI
ncbi:MAG TPA: winged helix-turn-helix domain-containing protein [Candidatus Acidoferrales bacterium]|nr:winged helix-turn-helix domain-containing protein [Candidatus Acidoferrales bacterium]